MGTRNKKLEIIAVDGGYIINSYASEYGNYLQQEVAVTEEDLIVKLCGKLYIDRVSLCARLMYGKE